jgi:hypothetical protein
MVSDKNESYDDQQRQKIQFKLVKKNKIIKVLNFVNFNTTLFKMK